LLDEVGEPSLDRDPSRPAVGDHYGALVRAIIGQQLSVAAARAIYGRLTALFDGRPPTPQELLDQDPEVLRPAVGLSRAKVVFLRSLAEHVLNGELELDALHALGDDEVLAALTAVKGIGEWSAHMFLMFQLERPDVLAVGDLGIRRAAQRAYRLPDPPSVAELTHLAEPWRPYRSAACRLLWRSLSNSPE
jgi:DNA-3-methyladenine glycosylase II